MPKRRPYPKTRDMTDKEIEAMNREEDRAATEHPAYIEEPDATDQDSEAPGLETPEMDAATAWSHLQTHCALVHIKGNKPSGFVLLDAESNYEAEFGYITAQTVHQLIADHGDELTNVMAVAGGADVCRYTFAKTNLRVLEDMLRFNSPSH